MGMACKQRFRLDIASDNETVRIGGPFRAKQRAIPKPRRRAPRPHGAAGRCDTSSARIRARHSISHATGRVGAGRERRE